MKMSGSVTQNLHMNVTITIGRVLPYTTSTAGWFQNIHTLPFWMVNWGLFPSWVIPKDLKTGSCGIKLGVKHSWEGT